jgi:CHAT domain-containing protein
MGRIRIVVTLLVFINISNIFSQKEELVLDIILFDFYSNVKEQNIEKAFFSSKKIDSLIILNEITEKKKLAHYNSSKGLVYYLKKLNPVKYLIKADSLNTLLSIPNKKVEFYSSFILANYYWDIKKDVKARNTFLKVLEFKDVPIEFQSFKNEAFDKYFLLERIFFNNNSDSTKIKSVAKKVVNFKKLTNDTLNISYGLALEYSSKIKAAENIFIKVKNITKNDFRFNKYTKFRSLSWLNTHYYKELNYDITDSLSAKKLIDVSKELLSVTNKTNFIETHTIYSIYSDIVIGSLIIKNVDLLNDFENKILTILNNDKYLKDGNLNLSSFFYSLHKLTMYFEFVGNYEKASFYALKKVELTKFLYGKISIEHLQSLRSYETIIKLKLFNYDKAYKISLAREIIIKELYTEESVEYLELLYNQYTIFLNKLEHNKGLNKLEKGVSLLKRINCNDQKICNKIKFSYLESLVFNKQYKLALDKIKIFKFDEKLESLFRLSKIKRDCYLGLQLYQKLNVEFEELFISFSKNKNQLIDKQFIQLFILDYQEYLRSTGRLELAISITEKYLNDIKKSNNDLISIDLITRYLNILWQNFECKKALNFIKNNDFLTFSNLTNVDVKGLKEYSYYYMLGNVYSCLNENKKALKAYKKALKYNYDKSNIYFQMMDVYIASGDLDKAKIYSNKFEKTIENIDNLSKEELFIITDFYIKNNQKENLLKYLLALSNKTIIDICKKSFFSSNDNKSDKASHDDVLRFILSYNQGEFYNPILAEYAEIISDLYKRKIDQYSRINLGIQKLKKEGNVDALKLKSLEELFNKNPSLIIEQEVAKLKTKIINSGLLKNELLCNLSISDVQKTIKENEVVISLFSYKYNLENKDLFAASFRTKELNLMSTNIFFKDDINLEKSNIVNSSFFDYINEFVLQNEKVNDELINTFYIIPSGKLNLINFSALSIFLEEKLGKKIKIHRINSLSDIIKIKKETNLKVDNLILIGDIDYDNTLGITSGERANKTRDIQLINDIDNFGIQSWGYLPGTKKEIDDIEKVAVNNKIEATTLSNDKVTEFNLNNLIINPSKTNVIHIATHGYFFSEGFKGSVENIFVNHKNPLLRSGLILSGANENWNNNKLVNPENDGILTSEEISFMDLSGVELVVLSACDTGLGEVSNLEGINGLQRAFKLAGANKLIMSLWKVPDKETAEFFRHFYKLLLDEQLTINESFRRTQKNMKEKYKPYYWASFVLLE